MLNLILLFIGTTEIIVIGIIALLIFGGKKIPELMRGLGKGMKEFKDGMNGTAAQENKEEKETENSKPETHTDEKSSEE